MSQDAKISKTNNISIIKFSTKYEIQKKKKSRNPEGQAICSEVAERQRERREPGAGPWLPQGGDLVGV